MQGEAFEKEAFRVIEWVKRRVDFFAEGKGVFFSDLIGVGCCPKFLKEFFHKNVLIGFWIGGLRIRSCWTGKLY